tara:strand:- start:31562 stop:31750 length:189 start_codon:yes stop_codon:yes gene_type:complete
MVKNNTAHFPRRFLPNRFKLAANHPSKTSFRDVFPEAYWTSFKVNLALQSWTPSQIRIIKSF